MLLRSVLLILDPGRVHGRCEGNKMGRNPVPITVLHLFVELVLADVKFIEIAKSVLHGFIHSPKTVLNAQIEVGASAAGIAKWHKLKFSDRLKGFPGCALLYN